MLKYMVVKSDSLFFPLRLIFNFTKKQGKKVATLESRIIMEDNQNIDIVNNDEGEDRDSLEYQELHNFEEFLVFESRTVVSKFNGRFGELDHALENFERVNIFRAKGIVKHSKDGSLKLIKFYGVPWPYKHLFMDHAKKKIKVSLKKRKKLLNIKGGAQLGGNNNLGPTDSPQGTVIVRNNDPLPKYIVVERINN